MGIMRNNKNTNPSGNWTSQRRQEEEGYVCSVLPTKPSFERIF